MSTMKPEQRRRKLFDVYAKNWKLIRPFIPLEQSEVIDANFQEAVMCPICMTLFNGNALNQTQENPLTIEHCPPEELGGKPLILLCKKCNNSAGHDLDIKLMEYLNVKPFNERQPQGKVFLGNTTFEGDALDVRGTMELKRLDDNSFYIDLKTNPKEVYRKNRFDNIIKANEIRITYKPHETPSAHIVHTALLKIGYLLAFSKFGHAFILNRNYDAIRNQIANPSIASLPSKGVIMNTSLPVGFYLIAAPKHLIGMAVVFSVKHNNQHDVNAVILNHPDTRDVDFYTELAKHEKETFRIQPMTINDLDYLNNLDHLQAYWEAIYSLIRV